MGYGAKEDAKYKADGIMRLLVILAAVGGGCIIFDNLVLNLFSCSVRELRLLLFMLFNMEAGSLALCYCLSRCFYI